MKRSHFLLSGFTFFSANLSVMLINYAFHIVAAKQFSAAGYGLMTALMAVFSVVAYASIGFQTKCADLAAKSSAPQNYNLSHPIFLHWLKISIFISLVITLLMLIFSASIAERLHTSQPYIWLLSGAIITVLPLSCLRGFLLGTEKHFALSLNMVAESLAKFVAAYFVLKIGYGLGAVLGTIITGQIVGIIIALFSISHTAGDRANFEPKPHSLTLPTWLMSMYFVCFALWSSLDVVVVQIFQPDVAGTYAVATRIGQIVLFSLTTMTTFLYPKFSMHSKDKHSFHNLFLPAIFIFIGVGLIVSLVLFGLREIVVLNVFGVQYKNAITWISYICMSALGLGLSHLAMHFMIAKANRKVVFVYCLLTLFFSIAILLSSMHSIKSLLFMMVAANWALFTAIFLYALRASKISGNERLSIQN